MLLVEISQKEIQVWTTKVKRVVCLQQVYFCEALNFNLCVNSNSQVSMKFKKKHQNKYILIVTDSYIYSLQNNTTLLSLLLILFLFGAFAVFLHS
jgi:hypothetical protein